MATTTTNFGWDIPQSTDLVKDGATAIAALGQDIDTSMVDLKGGTTGQILSKASGTDMDFTWINNDQGDITGVTAGTGLTGGGTSGSVTLDFDVANYGGGQYAAGKNKIINGDFGIWQRGTSISQTTGNQVYTADRFLASCTFSAGTASFSQQTFTAGTAPVAGYEGTYFGRQTCGSTSTASNFYQRIESVRTFAGQTVTFSFWAKASTALTYTVYGAQVFGSGGSANVDLFGNTINVTTSWQRFTQTITIPSIAGKTIGTNDYLLVGFYYTSGTLNSATIDTWGWQLEAGSTATQFQTATGTIQGELAACQRYYQVFCDTSSYGEIMGQFYSTTAARFTRPLLVSLRTSNPTITFPSGTFTNFIEEVGVANRTPTAFSANGSSKTHITFSATGMTGATTNTMAAFTTSATAITISSEL